MKQLEAKWIDKDGVSDFWWCSYCDYKAWYWEAKDICPGCRAKMIGYVNYDENEENKDK